MSASPYVNFYTSDFMAGTSGMTAATKGVYIILLCLMYEGEAPLQQSHGTLARRCGCTKSAFRNALDVLIEEGKVAVSDDGIWSDKCDKHIALRHERSKSATTSAKKRWGKSERKQGGVHADAMRSVCKPEPEPEPDKENEFSLGLTPEDLAAGERYVRRLKARRMDYGEGQGNIVALPDKLERGSGGT